MNMKLKIFRAMKDYD